MNFHTVLSIIMSMPIIGVIICIAAVVGYQTRLWRWPLFSAGICLLGALFVLFIGPHLIATESQVKIDGLMNTVVLLFIAGFIGLAVTLGGLLKTVTKPNRVG